MDEWSVYNTDHRWRGQTDHLLEALQLNAEKDSVTSQQNLVVCSIMWLNTGTHGQIKVLDHGAGEQRSGWKSLLLSLNHKSNKRSYATSAVTVELQLFAWEQETLENDVMVYSSCLSSCFLITIVIHHIFNFLCLLLFFYIQFIYIYIWILDFNVWLRQWTHTVCLKRQDTQALFRNNTDLKTYPLCLTL